MANSVFSTRMHDRLGEMRYVDAITGEEKVTSMWIRNGYSVGVYGTFLANEADRSGLYVDSWLQYSWFRNSVSSDTSSTEKYDSDDFTVSAESGYTCLLSQSQDPDSLMDSWYIQPKMQVTYMGIKMDDHTERNGTRITGEDNNNVQTRLGVKAYGCKDLKVAHAQ